MTALSSFLIEHSQDVLTFDVETGSKEQLLGFSMAWGKSYEQSAFFWMDDPQVNVSLRHLARKFVTHYGAYDASIMLKLGVQIGIEFDTYSAARIILYDRKENFGLKDLAKEFFGEEWGSAKDLIDRYGGLEFVPRPMLEQYCRNDSVNTYRLYSLFNPMLAVRRFIANIEAEMNLCLAEMETVGIGFDFTHMDSIKKTINDEMSELEANIRTWIPKVSLSSNDDIARWMFTHPEGLKLPTEGLPTTAKTKRVSVKADLFDEYRDRHPLFGLIADWKKLEKLKNTYTDSYANAAKKSADQRIHSHFNSFGANTGRLSSSNPNMQNIPSQSHGVIIRKAFIARPGYVLVSLDLKQIELIILAVMSGDKTMLQYFKDGKDIHTMVASVMYEVPESAVTKEQRNSYKAYTYGRVYGGGFWLAKSLVSSLPEDQQLPAMRTIESKWYSIFPGVKEYHNKHWTSKLQMRGYNETYFHRRRPLHKLPSGAPNNKRAALMRLLINGDIQGTAGDLHKIGMVRCLQLLRVLNNVEHVSGNDPAGYLVNCVHDELVFEVRKDILDYIVNRLIDKMTDIPEFPIKLSVDCEVGDNWYDMMPMNEYLQKELVKTR